MIQKYIYFPIDPVEIEAVQITENFDIHWLKSIWTDIQLKSIFTYQGESTPIKQYLILTLEHPDYWVVKDKMRGDIGDWIIKGTFGEFYFCKDGVFQKKYRKHQS